ncbi:MAG: DUF4249 domain-containing protein [Bacteroidales bacterium]|nr:DUF4249 domain-containing protein [Bacteroidales bacterium]
MKKHNLTIFLITGLQIILGACDSMISEVDAPDSDPKLVVTAFLSPDDDSVSVSVFKSRPLYVPSPGWDSSFPPVNNATVTLSDGLNSVIIPFSPASGTYRAPSSTMPVLAGKSYSLTVTTPDGYDVSSSCTIPAGTVPEIEITGIDTINQYGSTSVKVSLRFRDLTGPGNFYRIAAGTMYGSEFPYDNYFSESGFERGEPYISDKNKDGEYFTFKTGEIYTGNSPENILYISLMLTEESYFNYHRSTGSGFGSEDFFAEPTPVFTNINGGLGVFAGVNGQIMEINLGNIR